MLKKYIVNEGSCPEARRVHPSTYQLYSPIGLDLQPLKWALKAPQDLLRMIPQLQGTSRARFASSRSVPVGFYS